MSALVRRAVDTDAEAIGALHIRSWQTAYRGHLPDPFLDALSAELERRVEFWRSHISASGSALHEIWVADVEAHVNGFMAIGPARNAESPGSGELYAIYVHPDCWRRGLGRILLQHATRRLTELEYSAAILWVLASNLKARGFYEHAGWTVDGGSKMEVLPDGTELREIRYRIILGREKGNGKS